MNTERVTLYMDGLEIVGNIHLQTVGQRITDLLNEREEQFLALTEVKIYDKRLNLVSEERFICINKNRISMVKPYSEATPQTDK